MADSKKLPRFTGSVPIEISDVYLAKDPMNATAKGALVGAMLNV